MSKRYCDRECGVTWIDFDQTCPVHGYEAQRQEKEEATKADLIRRLRDALQVTTSDPRWDSLRIEAGRFLDDGT